MNVSFETRPTLHGKHIAVATLDAPRALNALDLEMASLLEERLLEWAARDDVVCLLLRGAGEKGFCAGGDVRQLALACQREPNSIPSLAVRHFEVEYRLMHRLRTFPKPVLAWGHGLVLGGGLGLLQGASVRIVTPSSRLGMPEVNIGLYPDVGAVHFLARAPGQLGLFLGLTGTQINASDALALNLADRLLLDEQQGPLLAGLAQINWDEQPQRQLLALLKTLEESARPSRPAARLIEHRSRIDALLDVSDVETAWHALATLREDEDPLLSTAGATLYAGCPLTTHLFWTHYQRSRIASLADILRAEYDLSLNCMRHPEFVEGVRARLLDKDQKPKWHWPDIDKVPTAVVEAHFEPSRHGVHPLAAL